MKLIRLIMKAQKRIRAIQLQNLTSVLTSYIKIFILYKKYNFPIWHVRNNYFYQPYKKEVVKIAKRFESDFAIELGGGLGEISSRIPSCLCTDIDDNVLRAARSMHPNLQTHKFDIFSDNLEQAPGWPATSKKVLLIAVNVIKKEKLEFFLEKIKKISQGVDLTLITDVSSDENRHEGSIAYLGQYNEFRILHSLDWPLDSRKIIACKYPS